MKTILIISILLIPTLVQAQKNKDEFEHVKSLFDQKEFSSALVEINNLIQKDSVKPIYYSYKSDIQRELHLYNESLETLNKAIEKFPSDHNLIVSRGVSILNFNYPDEAIEDFNLSLQLAENDSMRVTSYVNLGAAKMWKRDFQGAYDDLFKAFKIDSLHLGVLSNLAAVCDDVNKGSETLKYLFKALAIDSTYVPAYAGIGYKYQDLGRHKEAIHYYDKVIQLNPDEALGFSNRSYNRLMLKDIDGAFEDIETSIQLYRENSYAYKIKALILIDMKDMISACENIHVAISKKYVQTYGDDIIALKEKYCK